jgi:hypothetical protein
MSKDSFQMGEVVDLIVFVSNFVSMKQENDNGVDFFGSMNVSYLCNRMIRSIIKYLTYRVFY